MTTTPELPPELQAIKDAGKIIAQLKRQAVRGKSPMAMLALVEVASVATLAVRALWFDRSYEFDPEDTTRALAARREWMSYQFSGVRLPVLHSWEGASDTHQEAMLKGIEFGPFKGRQGKGTQMKMLIKAMILPQFQRIQFAPLRPAGIEGKIWKLPALAPDSAKLWTDVIVDWLWERHRAKMENPESWLYKLAAPEVEAQRDLNKRDARLSLLRSKLKRKDGGEMGPVNATKFSEKEKILKAEMNNPRITPAHIRNGLKTGIKAYLSSNLASRETPH